ncbi:16S rRNA pseudouridine516 synthase [Salinibacillus kushneri]|uniref:Pseudouridine synthase n=1 Tax=Salinibacillus kushneri TaxID=237682 RepID=A0A1I0JD71_9BACI|nr:pseudouridine synthase [Salinibacillus kushneri]SEU08036.1 16S rRNA pseudouridine516 synthase [Salinibacillus kushneri]
MRLDKLLANMGYGSRSDVKKILKKGIVQIDETIAKNGKTQVNPKEQEVFVNGEKVEYKEYVYLMMNKPKGVISATEDPVQTSVVDLLEMEDQIFNPFPVGRLDKDTEGLLLLTNDGKLSHEILSPKKKVGKRYWAKIAGEVTKIDVQAFSEGIELDDGYITKPGQLTIVSSGPVSEIELTIMEGKFHQVKRMFRSVGKEVTELKRLQMGNLQLDNTLEPGEYRELTDNELHLLRN